MMIKTYWILAEGTPEKIIRDSRGVLIEEGLTVAYNYQGSVKKGKILEYESEWKISRPDSFPKNWWSCKFKMKVLNEDGHISIIKNPNSFIII